MSSPHGNTPRESTLELDRTTFLSILIEYFGEVTAPVLRDNFDIVHQLLEEILCACGHSLTTAPNVLHGIVLPPSFVSKLFSGSLDLPGLCHLFDLVGTLNAVLNKDGTVTTSSVLGNINYKLSADSTLLCPDGRFTLMEYRSADSSASKPGASLSLTAAAVARLQVQVPFTPRAFLSITDHSGALEDVVVKLYFGSSATDATCSVAGAGAGKWMCAPAWRTLRSGWSLAHSRFCPFRLAQISFVLPAGALLSALKIGELELSVETYKPLQGHTWARIGY
ncbi:hypothetical protein H4582DRAFT_2104399 [Lactarius indigo]|nr:hypothetical protein H4582DRAFT_2104399 [Lactarius indigo]